MQTGLVGSGGVLGECQPIAVTKPALIWGSKPCNERKTDIFLFLFGLQQNLISEEELTGM